ncbi:MAG: hypothetical protein Q4F95_09435 [Oscillospiraceae bacterium]|nr:hypothetical protein [Oscillospiraceae bacterium]
MKKVLISMICKQSIDKCRMDVKNNVVSHIHNKVKKTLSLGLAAMIMLTATACRSTVESKPESKKSVIEENKTRVTSKAETSWYPGKDSTYNGRLRWGCQNQEQMAYVESVMDATFYSGWYEDCKAKLTEDDWECLEYEKKNWSYSDAYDQFLVDCYVASKLQVKNDYAGGGYGDPAEVIYSAYQELVGSTSNCGSRAQFHRAFLNRIGYETSFVESTFLQHAWYCVYLSDGTVVDMDGSFLGGGSLTLYREPDVIVYDKED